MLSHRILVVVLGLLNSNVLATPTSLDKRVAAAAKPLVGGLPHCDDLVASFGSEGGNGGCYVDYQPGTNTTIEAREVDPESNVLSKRATAVGPTCVSNSNSVPWSDSQNLCNNVPMTWSQVHASDGNGCSCWVHARGLAAWAVCNCSRCNYMTFNNFRSLCYAAAGCIPSPGGTSGGYFKVTGPRGYLSLYRQGIPNPPQYETPGWC